MKTTEQILREQITELERLLELKQIRIVELENQLSKPSSLVLRDQVKICTGKCAGSTAGCVCNR